MSQPAITSEQRTRLVDATCVVSCSTGKDSVATSLWLTENGIEHERIFMDTRWEHDEVAMGHVRDERHTMSHGDEMGGNRIGMVSTIRFPEARRGAGVARR